ncbi:MAG: glycosyltransferase [Egibacteraceae bacterium]
MRGPGGALPVDTGDCVLGPRGIRRGARPPESGTQGRVGIVVRSFPRLSQTFVLSEILALERLGLELEVFALTDPHEPITQPEVAAVRAPIHYLQAVPTVSLRALGYLARRATQAPGYAAASRLACLGQAAHLAGLVRDRQVRHLHAHFAHDPTLVALLASLETGVPFSFTAHARDLYQVPRPALADRAARATHVVTCCQANADYLAVAAPAAAARVIFHGVDVERFRPGGPAEPGLIVSIGRLVEKKGFAVLLAACQRLAAREFRCVIYGDGPLRAELAAQIDRLGLAGRVSLAGACTQRELAGVLQRAEVFAFTPLQGADGDRDGIPNVLLEAMASGLAVVSTAVGGVGEAVQHGVNGLLAEPGDADAVAGHLAALLEDDGGRRRLGAAARQTAVERFDARVWAQQLAALLTAPSGVPS